MNICFVSKYPPIQGGVSMHCYWAARGLAERGHRVVVVTNANEVEATFRIHLSDNDLELGGAYAPTFDEGGSVRVVSTEPPDRRQLYYIPLNNPTATRLSTLATDIIHDERADVIFSYYLEPYGLASHLAGHWTQTPYVFKHAGSDLHRLFDLPDLKTAYLEVLLAASRILSRGVSRQKLIDHGVDPLRIASDVAFGVPTTFFHPGVTGYKLHDLLDLARHSPGDLPTRLGHNALDNVPVLGFYGKLGEFKGSFDLLVAAAQLIKRGFPLVLVGPAHGWQEARFLRLAADLGIDDHVYLLPFLPHWEVPRFIRSCTAVCFLERDFPITAHTPTIPSEIIACGSALVVSEEVARKQMFRSSIRNRQNVVVVSDPKNHDELASALRFILEDRERAEEIGRRGLADFGTGRPHDAYVSRLEAVLEEAAAEGTPRARNRAVGSTGGGPRKDPIELVPSLYPYTAALLTAAHRAALRSRIAGSALGSSAGDRRTLGVQFGVHLGTALEDVPETSELLRELCRYERRLYDWLLAQPLLPPASLEAPPEFTLDTVGRLYVRLRAPIELVDFSVDVDAVMAALDSGNRQPSAGEPCRILFHPSGTPFRVNAATTLLLDRIREGDARVREILDEFLSLLTSDAARMTLDASLLSTLESLYWEGLIGFTEDRREGDSHLGMESLNFPQPCGTSEIGR